MKELLLSISVLFLLITVACNEKVVQQGDRGYHVKVGDMVENIEFNLIDGSTL